MKKRLVCLVLLLVIGLTGCNKVDNDITNEDIDVEENIQTEVTENNEEMVQDNIKTITLNFEDLSIVYQGNNNENCCIGYTTHINNETYRANFYVFEEKDSELYNELLQIYESDYLGEVEISYRDYITEDLDYHLYTNMSNLFIDDEIKENCNITIPEDLVETDYDSYLLNAVNDYWQAQLDTENDIKYPDKLPFDDIDTVRAYYRNITDIHNIDYKLLGIQQAKSTIDGKKRKFFETQITDEELSEVVPTNKYTFVYEETAEDKHKYKVYNVESMQTDTYYNELFNVMEKLPVSCDYYVFDTSILPEEQYNNLIDLLENNGTMLITYEPIKNNDLFYDEFRRTTFYKELNIDKYKSMHVYVIDKIIFDY